MADDDKKNPVPPQKPIAERKEKPKKEDKKVEKDTQKEVITTNKNLDALVSANVSSADRAERKADALSKSVDAQKEIDKLNAAGRTKDAENFQKALDESVKLLKGSRNDKSIENRLAELTAINDQANKISESLQKTIANDPSVSGIERLTQKIEDQTSTIESDTTAMETGKRLDKLGGMFGQFSNSQTQELQDSFNQAQEDLKDAIESGDTAGEDLARAQLEAISKGAESEENRREAQKLNEEANSRLMQIANGMENIARLKLANPDIRDLKRGADGLYRRIDGAEPLVDRNVSVQSGSLESSNINLSTELTSLINLQRQFEMQIKMMKKAEEIDTASDSLLRVG